MKRLTLLRHAKSSWQTQHITDHERPLNERGLNDAPMMAERLLKRVPAPDLLLVSSAVRTRATAAALQRAFALSDEQLDVREELYLASPAAILELVRSVPDTLEHVLVIGHNPGLEELALSLSEDAPQNLVTSAVVHLHIDGSYADLGRSARVHCDFSDWPKRPQ